MTLVLSEIATRPPPGTDRAATEARTRELLELLREQQKKLHAQGRFSALVVLQGLDASGKDGAINDVFSGLNLLGLRVKGFKAPSELERKHDFLWRVHAEVPERGMLTVFNRSHYEDVLVPKVEGWVDAATIERRYQRINEFEGLLADHDTTVVKLYLHKSEAEQRADLEERLTQPEKHWKHNDGDWATLSKRQAYLEAYDALFARCSAVAPWHVIPADKSWYKSHRIAEVVTAALAQLPLAYPPLDRTSQPR